MRTRRHARLAFTLVEVLVVVAIMGLAAAIVVPQMLNPGTLHIQAAVRTIIADLMVAQNEAVVRQSPRQVIFNLDASQYTLADADGQPIAAPWGKDGVYRVSFKSDSRFSNVRIESVAFGQDEDSNKQVQFDEMGVPNQGGTIVVASGTTRYRITVAPFTGKVTVETVAATSGG